MPKGNFKYGERGGGRKKKESTDLVRDCICLCCILFERF